MPATKKVAASKAGARKKVAAKASAGRRPAASKTSAKRPPAKPAAAKKATAKKTTAKKAAVKKAPAKKVAAKKPATRAPRGLGLQLGLNTVDPAKYAGWDGLLAACENDARDMAALAASRKIRSTVLLTQQATRSAVLAQIRAAARALGAGDLFFMSFSGHGGQVKDADGDEDDGRDETWCLYDGQLIDDELYFEFTRFKPGVRILMLSDSCHSGTVAREGPPEMGQVTVRNRLMPPAIANRVYEAHKDFYDGLQLDVARQARRRSVDPDAALAQLDVVGPASLVAGQMKAALILISGCQDNQTSLDGDRNGAFTEAFLKVWGQGTFSGHYAALHARVKQLLPPSQTPNLFTLGKVGTFLAQPAFQL